MLTYLWLSRRQAWQIKSKNEEKCERGTETFTVLRVRGLWFGAKLGPVQHADLTVQCGTEALIMRGWSKLRRHVSVKHTTGFRRLTYEEKYVKYLINTF